jgi:hypothetical protein
MCRIRGSCLLSDIIHYAYTERHAPEIAVIALLGTFQGQLQHALFGDIGQLDDFLLYLSVRHLHKMHDVKKTNDA